MKTSTPLFVVSLVLWSAFNAALSTGIAQGTAFTYQGRLDSSGAPYTGSAEFQPTLWTAESGGSPAGTNNPVTLIVGVTNGLFLLPLDFGDSPFGAGAERWLQLEVRTAIGPFTPLLPRQRLTATPYALTAGNLVGILSSSSLAGSYNEAVTFNNAANLFSGSGAGLTSLNASQLATGTVPDGRIAPTITRDTEVLSLVLDSDGAGSDLDADLLDGLDSTVFVRTNGPVAIGGSSTTAAILTVTQSGSQNGILATTASADFGEAAVTGRAGAVGPVLNSVAGVFGTSSAGRGVIGSSTTGNGVLGYSTSSHGVAAQSQYGYGLSAYSQTNTAVYGISVSGNGIQGVSSSGNGVEGYANASSGTVYGVRGVSQSSTQGAGVRGESEYVGVWGESTGRWGVYGRSTGTSNSYGIYGAVSGGTGNYAGYFQGNVHVNGTLSKSGGSFKIDHPLDPANKYLSHSFVESPDMMNVYNGNVILDETGAASVTLPGYFEALNRDFRYQLTPVGGPGPNLHVAEPVHGNVFKIAGGTPRLEVSWQVTGIRKDPFANAHRIVVEETKPLEEQGTYLCPEAFAPEETGLHPTDP